MPQPGEEANEKRPDRPPAPAGHPDMILAAVLALALGDYRLSRAGIHGPRHWLRVLQNGRELAARTPGADLEVVEHFALLHDCCRLNDGADPQHGQRAADMVLRLRRDGRLLLTPQQVATLAKACARHELGEVIHDPTIGTCWDADRLELSRLGCRPISHLLSTAAALDPGIQASAWHRGTGNALDRELANKCGLEISP